MDKKTYKVKYKCRNCGHKEILEVPFGKPKDYFEKLMTNGYDYYYEGKECKICGNKSLITEE